MARDLWVQALTYFRDLNPHEDSKYIKKALRQISQDKDTKEEVLNPIMVLEILKSKPKLKFDVLKEYLLERLDKQSTVIRKNTSQLEENMNNIKSLKKSISELNSQASTSTRRSAKLRP